MFLYYSYFKKDIHTKIIVIIKVDISLNGKYQIIILTTLKAIILLVDLKKNNIITKIYSSNEYEISITALNALIIHKSNST